MSSLEKFIDPTLPYDFWRGPEVVRSFDDARKGLNCIALAHLAIRDLFGLSLPRELHCLELYQESTFFSSVEKTDDLQLGDLLWFGTAGSAIEPQQFEPVYHDGRLVNWGDFPVKHVGEHTGETEAGEPLILHATHIDGSTAVWPLGRFGEYRRYERIFDIRRLNPQFKQAA